MPNFFLYLVSSALQSKIDTATIAATFEKAESANLFHLHGTSAFSYGVPIFVWVLINAEVVFVIKMGAQYSRTVILCGCLFCVGAYYPNFYGMHFAM